MSQTKVRIPTPLRRFTGGAKEVPAAGDTVREVLADVVERHAGLRDQILAGDGGLRSFVNVFLGDTNVRSIDGLDSKVGESAVVSIVPAVAGGRP